MAGGGEKGGLYLRLSAQFGEVGGGKRGEGGDEMEREKYKNKKRNTGINKRPGHFLSFFHVLDWNREELSWRRGICYRELEERINGCLG